MKIAELISQGEQIASSGNDMLFEKWKAKILNFLLIHSEIGANDTQVIRASLEYVKNPFSELENKIRLSTVINETIKLLKLLDCKLQSAHVGVNALSRDTAIEVLSLLLKNFYKHIEIMYQGNTHGSAGITLEMLELIKIKNEYDVQRILYSLIKPIFPLARVEKQADGGYSGVRCDIVLDEYDIWVEVKCTRDNMSERKLTEEIGSDITHYNSQCLMFFVYDKEKIIKNKEAFEHRYTSIGNDRYKNIRTFVTQPISL